MSFVCFLVPGQLRIVERDEKKRDVHKYSLLITFVVFFPLPLLPSLIFIAHVYSGETEEGKKREGTKIFL